jgi:hypothetical protein
MTRKAVKGLKDLGATLILAAALAVPAVAQMGSTAAPVEQSCIELNRMDTTKAVSDETIIVKLIGSGDYRKVTVSPRCPGLQMQDSFGYSTSLPRLCKGDLITVTGGQGSTCGISEITTISEQDARALTAR